MKCNRCNDETTVTFTSGNDLICEKCLEKEIYKERKRIYKKDKKQRVVKKVSNLLIGIFIGFGICFTTTMIVLAIRELIR